MTYDSNYSKKIIRNEKRFEETFFDLHNKCFFKRSTIN